MTTHTNEHGNYVERGSDHGADRYKYDSGKCSRSNGWKQYDTNQDAWYFGVWVHVERQMIFTYAEGDTCTTTCHDIESFRAELKSMAEFYGSPPPAAVGIDPDGQVTEYYDERPTA